MNDPSTDEDSREKSVFDLELDSPFMKWKEVRALEKQLKSSPNDFECRARLAFFYAMQAWRTPNKLQTLVRGLSHAPSTEEIRARFIEHWLWVVANHPESRVNDNYFGAVILRQKTLQKQVYNLWHEQLVKHPADARVHWNAASFIGTMSLEESTALRKKACLLDPSNPKYPRELAQRLSHLADFSVNRNKAKDSLNESDQAKCEALALQEDALSLAEPDQLLDALVITAKLAFKTGHLEKTKEYAQRILDFDFSSEYAFISHQSLHSAHILLGRIALIEGNKEKALECLGAAASIKIEFWNIQSPDLTLAADLLLLGEKRAVEKYLEGVLRFFPSPEIIRLYFLIRFNLLPKSSRLDESRSKTYTNAWFHTIRALNACMSGFGFFR